MKSFYILSRDLLSNKSGTLMVTQCQMLFAISWKEPKPGQLARWCCGCAPQGINFLKEFFESYRKQEDAMRNSVDFGVLIQIKSPFKGNFKNTGQVSVLGKVSYHRESPCSRFENFLRFPITVDSFCWINGDLSNIWMSLMLLTFYNYICHLRS